MLTISVNNLGPIVEGAVDVKPLTIFVGPSNTGKSYMAMAIHAVMKAFGAEYAGGMAHYDYPDAMRRRLMRRRFALRRPMDDPEKSRAILTGIREWTKGLEDQEPVLPELTVASLPEVVRSEVEKITQEALGLAQRDVIQQLRQTYGEPSDFIRHQTQQQDFRLNVHRDVPFLSVSVATNDDWLLPPQFDISKAPIEPPEDEHLAFAPELLDSEQGPFLADELLAEMKSSATGWAMSEFPPHSHYLPAARSGIAQGHKVLSAALIRQSSRIGLEQFNIPTLPGITTEFLSSLLSLDRRMPRRRHNKELRSAVNFIENEVLHGQVDLDESGGVPYPEMVYLPTGVQEPSGKFTLDRTSSMVSELAPLILFLKYLVQPGDMLILEEPESHLHPAAQRRMAQGIVRLVNAGVKVIITTHSDMFVGQINNFLALSQASQELIEERGFGPSDFLEQEQVSAYLFKHDPELGGSVIQSLEIDPDTGIDEDEFADVIEAIYNESIALQRDSIL